MLFINGAMANSIDGIFSIGKSTDGRTLIRFSGASIKRFAIQFAFFNENDWRYRFRAVITHQEGVLCFPMQRSVDKCGKKYLFPEEYSSNTVLGIRTAAEDSRLGFRVLAHENGTPFGQYTDDYYGHVTWSQSMDLIQISPNLTLGGCKKSLRFTRLLYENDGRNSMHDIATIPREKIAPNPEEERESETNEEDGAWGGLPRINAVEQVPEIEDDLETFMAAKIVSLCKDVMFKLRSP